MFFLNCLKWIIWTPCWPSGRSFHISPSSTSLSTSFVLLKEGIELGECQEDKRKKRRSRGWSVGSIPTLSFSLPLFFLFRDQAERNVKTEFIVMLTSHWIAPWFMNASLDARFNFFVSFLFAPNLNFLTLARSLFQLCSPERCRVLVSQVNSDRFIIHATGFRESCRGPWRCGMRSSWFAQRSSANVNNVQ